jgi:PAS domain S-box-containing protein
MSTREKDTNLDPKWFETTLRSVGDAVIATDAEGNVKFMNHVAEQLTGWTAAEAASQPLARVLALRDEATREAIESPVAAFRCGAIWELSESTVLSRRDGTEVHIDDSAAPIRDDGGTLLGFVVVFRDDTAKRRDRCFIARATAELCCSLDYERTLAKVAELAVLRVADCCAVHIAVGDGVRRLAVAHRDPAKARLLESWEASPLPDLKDGRGVQHVLRTGQAEVVPELTADMLDLGAVDPAHRVLLGELQPKSYVRVPLCRGADGIGVFGVITMVSAESGRRYGQMDLNAALAFAHVAAVAIENVRLVNDLEHARLDADVRRVEAEVASRAKDEFLAILGHELRNPLAPVLTALQLIRMRAGKALAHECTIIDRQLKHVLRLVNDLLDASRIARGKVEITKESLEVAEVVAAAIEMVSPLLEQRQQDIEVSVPPELWVSGDRCRLAQVVSNLLRNAVKYSDKCGHVSIEVHRDDHEAVLTVRDRGIGIEASRLSEIFELFVQAPQALDRADGGLGAQARCSDGLWSRFRSSSGNCRGLRRAPGEAGLADSHPGRDRALGARGQRCDAGLTGVAVEHASRVRSAVIPHRREPRRPHDSAPGPPQGADPCNVTFVEGEFEDAYVLRQALERRP